MSDLKNKKLIYLKGLLFLGILIISASLILLKLPKWEIFILLALTIWASARLYYFMFYVIENYVDPNYKFASIYSFIKYLFTRSKE